MELHAKTHIHLPYVLTCAQTHLTEGGREHEYIRKKWEEKRRSFVAVADRRAAISTHVREATAGFLVHCVLRERLLASQARISLCERIVLIFWYTFYLNQERSEGSKWPAF